MNNSISQKVNIDKKKNRTKIIRKMNNNEKEHLTTKIRMTRPHGEFALHMCAFFNLTMINK